MQQHKKEIVLQPFHFQSNILLNKREGLAIQRVISHQQTKYQLETSYLIENKHPT